MLERFSSNFFHLFSLTTTTRVHCSKDITDISVYFLQLKFLRKIKGKKFKKLLQVRNQIPNNVIITNHCLGEETTFFTKSTFSATFLVGQRQVQERKKILFWQCQRHHCQQHGGPHHGYVHPQLLQASRLLQEESCWSWCQGEISGDRCSGVLMVHWRLLGGWVFS